MTKAQREKAERLMLKQTLESNPKIKEIIDAMIDNPNPEIKDIVQPIIEEKLKEARMTGILIGWQSFALRAIENIKNMQTIDEVKAYFQGEANKVKDKLVIDKGNIEDFDGEV